MRRKQNTIAIILARGGSKGIKNKNLIKVNKKPLIYWSIRSCMLSKKIASTWVSSDDKKILQIAKNYRCNVILRPKKYSTDKASSESAWMHAIKCIEKNFDFETVIGIQPTSPLRPINCFDKAINKFKNKKLDSLFSSNNIYECNIWKKNNKKIIANYNYRKRPRRQDIGLRYYENGSFYIFDKKKFKKFNCRLFGKIGFFQMKKIFGFQIDEKEDIVILNNLKNFFK